MKRTYDKFKRFFQDFYLVLVLIFLYAPIAVMMVLSFNSSKSRSQWGGFTTQWYKEMFESPVIMEALYNTLMIAFLSAIIATILGTAAAIGISSMKKAPRTIFMGINNIPMLNSDIVTGISLMLMFVAFGVSLGFKTILVAHITFNVPYVMTSVLPKLKQTSKYTYEAAMDLGAGPVEAFFKVVFPDIMPGVLSGFLMAFTMSLDDFIITHFTKGAGINTLSTLIYSEVRRGIKPSMYALSTVIFVTVLALLLITNFAPSKSQMEAKAAAAIAAGKKPNTWGQKLYKAALVMTSFIIISVVSYTTYMHFDNSHSDELYVYNWGEYIDEEVIELFEEETGIKVNYKVYESNEQLYSVLKQGGVNYDVIIPSDYMISRLIEEDMLEKIDMNNVPNISKIDPEYLNREFDPNQEYSVPYTWGVVGLIYNSTMVDEPVTSWKTLFDEKYAGQILQFDNSRDAMATALFSLGYSVNTTDEAELQEAFDLLVEQKGILQAYVMDTIYDKLESGDAAIGAYYAGDALTMMEINPDLRFCIPEEGTNFFVDAMCIPKGAANKQNAEYFIDFMCNTDIALRNMDVTGYATPSAEAYAELDEETQNNEILFPKHDVLENCETYINLPQETLELYNDFWTKLKS